MNLHPKQCLSRYLSHIHSRDNSPPITNIHCNWNRTRCDREKKRGMERGVNRGRERVCVRQRVRYRFCTVLHACKFLFPKRHPVSEFSHWKNAFCCVSCTVTEKKEPTRRQRRENWVIHHFYSPSNTPVPSTLISLGHCFKSPHFWKNFYVREMKKRETCPDMSDVQTMGGGKIESSSYSLLAVSCRLKS